MAISNISSVTQALTRLVELCVGHTTDWNAAQPPTIVSRPPDQMPDNSLGIYLYHVMEEGAFKNQPPAGSSRDPVPVRSTPIGLRLFYLVTTDETLEQDEQVNDAQLLMGLAIKCLHDHPIITEDTTVLDAVGNPINIFNEVGLANSGARLHVSMQPVEFSDAVSYWTAGSSPLRLAAYYEVSMILMEPEAPDSYAGRVLSFGLDVATSRTPRLTSSVNHLQVTPPAPAQAQNIRIQPAQVPINDIIHFYGSNLASDDTQLLIKHESWDDFELTDFRWQVAAASDTKVTAQVQRDLGSHVLIPGIYVAKLQTTRYAPDPLGGTKAVTTESNQMPFTIMPRIDTISAPDANDVITITGDVLHDGEQVNSNVSVAIGNFSFEVTHIGPMAAMPMVNPGESQIIDENTIRLRLVTAAPPPVVEPGIIPAGTYPLQIIINGAQSSPAWVTL